jgi:zinc transporter ZupT
MTYIALILPVLLGYLLVKLVSPSTKILQLFLSFSGAYLLSMTVLHMIPEIFIGGDHEIGLFILLGIAIQTGLEHLSKGAEHGHLHSHDFQRNIPWLLLLSLGVHAFLEGMPLGIEQNRELLYAIIIHKLPIAFILATFLIRSALPTSAILLIMVLFAIMSPLGSWVALTWETIQSHSDEITAIVIGVFLHISNAILFESSENHKFNLHKFIAVLIGFGVALLSMWH